MTHLCDMIPGERAGDRKRKLAQAAATKAKREAAKDYNAQIAERERRANWRVALDNASTRRERAEQHVAELVTRVAGLERRAMDDHRVLSLIRPARDDLEVAREILARTIAAEDAERARYAAKVAEADTEAAQHTEVAE